MPGSAHAGASFMFVPDPAQPSLASGSTVATVADLTGTGVPDLVLIDEEADSVGVMLGNGAGGFGVPTWYQLAGKPADDVSVADFNNDGHADLLVGIETAPPRTPQEGTTPNKVQILSGDGQGNFTVGQAIALPEIGPVYVGNFTGDGEQDVVVVPDVCTAEAMAVSTTCCSATDTETSRRAPSTNHRAPGAVVRGSATSPEMDGTTSSRNP